MAVLLLVAVIAVTAVVLYAAGWEPVRELLGAKDTDQVHADGGPEPSNPVGPPHRPPVAPTTTTTPVTPTTAPTTSTSVPTSLVTTTGSESGGHTIDVSADVPLPGAEVSADVVVDAPVVDAVGEAVDCVLNQLLRGNKLAHCLALDADDVLATIEVEAGLTPTP